MIDQGQNIEQLLVAKLIINPDEINTVKYYVNLSMIQDQQLQDIYSSMCNGQTNPANIVEDLKKKYPDILHILHDLSDLGYSSPFISIKGCCDALARKQKFKTASEIIPNLLSSMDISKMEETLTKVSDQISDLLPVGDAEVITLSDLPNRYSKEYFTSEYHKRFMTGFDVLDRATGGIDLGDLIICAARPGCGKTVFGLDLIRNNADLKAGYFNLEMTSRQIYERQIASIGKIPLGTLRRSVRRDQDTLNDFKHSNEVLSTMKNCELITGALSVADIERFVRIKHYDYIVIDYLGLIQSSVQYKGNRYAETSAISSGLKHIAMKYRIPVIALAQLNRESAKRDDKEPFLSELRDSGAIEQDASVVFMLWEHEDNTKRNIKIEKCRNGQRVRSVLNFDGEHMHFSEIGISENNPFTERGNNLD